MYTEKEIEDKFSEVLRNIEAGKSIVKACEGVIGKTKFYELIDEDGKKAERYARACAFRQEYLFEQILEIADTSDNDIVEVDGEKKVNHENIQRDRLRVDARKWALAKMNPKKYGDKVDYTSGGEKINMPIFNIDPLDESNNSDKKDK